MLPFTFLFICKQNKWQKLVPEKNEFRYHLQKYGNQSTNHTNVEFNSCVTIGAFVLPEAGSREKRNCITIYRNIITNPPITQMLNLAVVVFSYFSEHGVIGINT